MVVQFKELGIVFNGYGSVKDDVGNYKTASLEKLFKRFASMIDNSVKTIVKENKDLGEMFSKRFINQVRCYNYAGADWSGRASYTNNMQRGVLQVNLAHIVRMASAGMPQTRIRQIIHEIVVHETAHMYYRFRPELTQKWSKAVIAIGKPIDDYSVSHKDKWSETLWANEIHSIMSEFLIARKDIKYCTDAKAYQEYKKLYIEMHS